MLGDEGYSQLVGFLKISLPLAALGLMSTVFLFARSPSGEATIPYADIESIAREPRVSEPQLSGVASDGSVIEISGRTARPDGAGLIIDGLAASIDTKDGTQIELRAGSGMIDNNTRVARLDGLTRVETSNGYDMETVGLTANMRTGRIESEGALEVQAPFGSLTAGHLIIDTPDPDRGQVMLFQNGVRLVYDPQR